jgi:hypothetical protein
VGGIITTPNFTPGGQSNYFLQDSSAAINIFSHNLDFEDIHNLNMGDGIYVTGQIGQYRGLTELEIKNPLHLSVLSRDNTLPAVKSVTLADVNESLESQLVEIEKVWLVNPDGWPKNNQNGTVYFTDGRDTLELFIDKDTNLDGWTAPENIFSVMGVVDQYTTHTPANNRYELRPRFQEDFAITSTVEQGNQMPMTFLLEQNQPNPFNPVTKIRIHLPVETEIQLDVYNILGNLVTTLFQGKIAAGRHVFYFKGNDLPTGTYFYRLTSDRFHSVKKMILLK